MNVLSILGSPRKRGNTATVLGHFERLVVRKHHVERINITDCTIQGCLGCDACQKVLDRPGCVRKDDAVAVLERIMDADLVVYATPLYVWSFSAQMKALLDRHYCMVKWQESPVAQALLSGKRAALLVTCGDKVEGNADLIQTIFEREMDYLGCIIVGKYVVPNCTTPDKLGSRAQQVVDEMVAGVTSAALLASESRRE